MSIRSLNLCPIFEKPRKEPPLVEPGRIKRRRYERTDRPLVREVSVLITKTVPYSSLTRWLRPVITEPVYAARERKKPVKHRANQFCPLTSLQDDRGALEGNRREDEG